MSVQVNQYLCYGYLLPYDKSESALVAKYSEDAMDEFYDKYHDSAYDEKIVEVDGCSLLSDGMNGEYNFFGKIFKKSEVHYPLNTMAIPKVTPKVKALVSEQLVKVFGEDFGLKPEILLVSHYR